MTWAEPDEVIDHRPAGRCGCGADLALAEDLGVIRSHQQLEVPAVTARRVQHDLHQARCGCGAAHVAGRPVAASALSIGPNLRVLAVYLTRCEAIDSPLAGSCRVSLARLRRADGDKAEAERLAHRGLAEIDSAGLAILGRSLMQWWLNAATTLGWLATVCDPESLMTPECQRYLSRVRGV